MKLLPKISSLSPEERYARLNRQLMLKESEIGGQLFGPVNKGVKRQFFCLDANTWIWHEEWQDEKGKHCTLTTRYDVRPDGVLKLQGSGGYRRLSQREANNLYQAVEIYVKKVVSDYQRLLQVV